MLIMSAIDLQSAVYTIILVSPHLEGFPPKMCHKDVIVCINV